MSWQYRLGVTLGQQRSQHSQHQWSQLVLPVDKDGAISRLYDQFTPFQTVVTGCLIATLQCPCLPKCGDVCVATLTEWWVLDQSPSVWTPYKWWWLLYVPSTHIFTYYSSVICHNQVGPSSPWHLSITEYFMLPSSTFSLFLTTSRWLPVCAFLWSSFVLYSPCFVWMHLKLLFLITDPVLS